MALDSGVRIGRYEIGRKLGQGGFGILYAARDHELGRDVAIKFLRPEHAFRPQVVQRFLQEARAAARISDPGIVTVYESGEVSGTSTRADGTVYIAMELLAGETLASRLRHGAMPYRMALGLCRQIATALRSAHQAGIVHRDLKPQNIFLVPDAAVLGGERVKILDFGIAKLVDDVGSALATHSMLMLGTPMYMSPEQCKSSARVDARSDVYSLGCIMFEMVTGKTPFEGDPGELIAKHQLVPAPAARSINRELPVVLDQLIESMLAKDPMERPPTMAAVMDVLDECEGRSIEPPTRPEHRALVDDVPSNTTVDDSIRSRVRRLLSGRMPLALGAVAAVAIGISVAMCSVRDDKPPPTAAVAPEDASVPIAELEVECLRAQVEKRWADLRNCGQRLAALDPAKGAGFVDTAANEIRDLHRAITPDAQAAPPPAPEPPEPEPEPEPEPVEKVAKVEKVEKKSTKARVSIEPPANCDADALKDEGMQSVNMGQHAAALSRFEASLKCRRDQYVVQLCFMESCAAGNSAKAKFYFKQLTPVQQMKFSQLCIRNKVEYQ